MSTYTMFLIAQAVIDPNATTVTSQWGFKEGISSSGAGNVTMSLNPDMNYAAPEARQVVATLAVPAGTPAAYHAQVEQNADPQAVTVSIFNAAGAAVTAPPAGSVLTITVLRAKLPQG